MPDTNNWNRPPVAWIVWIVGVAMTWPALAVVLVWRRIKWQNAWVSLSVLLNIFFIGVCVIVALDERTESQRAEERLWTLIEPDCVEFEPEFLKFCRPRIGSDLARRQPTAIFVAELGVPRVLFEYEDENPQTVTDIVAYDKDGRSWVSVNFQAGLVSFDHYSDASCEPDLSFLDRDLDGIPDKKIDWELKKGFERVGEIVWRPIKKKDD